MDSPIVGPITFIVESIAAVCQVPDAATIGRRWRHDRPGAAGS